MECKISKDLSFFETEVRDGFIVPAYIKYGWASQMKILSEVVSICEKHNLTYYAGWGTLLGTIRHKGYVPWDDDLDICMKRKEYEQFLIYAREELPSNMVLYNVYNRDMHGNCITSIFNAKEDCYDNNFIENYGSTMQVGIDIFALDYMPVDEEEFRQFGEAIDFIISLRAQYNDLSEKEKMLQLRKVKETLGVDINPRGENSVTFQLGLLLERICSSYEQVEDAKITNLMVWQHYRAYVFEQEWYGRIIEMPFEDINMPVPVGYDSILRLDYGDYMTPSCGGIAHDYPYFLNNYYNSCVNLGKEEYLPKNMDFPRDGKDIERMNQTRWNEYVSKAEKIEAEIRALGDEGDDSKIDILKQELVDISNELENDIIETNNREKISLFVACQVKHWDKIEELYRSEQAKEGVHAYVLVVPYHHKNYVGEIIDTLYEIDEYPNDVELLDYTQVDWDSCLVDKLFFQMPWDKYDDALCVDEQYYCANLKNKTAMLIYVPYFRNAEYDDNNERAKLTTQNTCRLPAPIVADRIVLESERMKEIYVSQLVDFVGEQTRSVWLQKIVLI